MRKFGLRDKIGYMFGDLGNDFSFYFVSGYLMLYYTDILEINAALVGFIFFAARIWDAFMDITIGRIADTSPPEKNGRFKPWIMRKSFPLVIFFILMFIKIPGDSDSFYVVYAIITYFFWGAFYSAVNIPYGSMASAITEDPNQRTSLSVFRTFGSSLAGLSIGFVTPYVLMMNNPTNQARFILITIIYGVSALICYSLVYFLPTERVFSQRSNIEELHWKSTFKGLAKNRPLIVLMGSSLMLLLSWLLNNSLNAYFFKNYFHSTAAMSLAAITLVLTTMILSPFSGYLSRKFGKKESICVGMLFTSVAYILLYVLPISNPFMFCFLFFFANVGVALFNVLIWALVLEDIDYQEYITGKREEGTIYAIYAFARKIGQALAGGIGGFILAATGYVNGASEQSVGVRMGIKGIYLLAPAIGYFLIFLIFTFAYPFNKDKLHEFTQKLAEKRERRARAEKRLKAIANLK